MWIDIKVLLWELFQIRYFFEIIILYLTLQSVNNLLSLNDLLSLEEVHIYLYWLKEVLNVTFDLKIVK